MVIREKKSIRLPEPHRALLAHLKRREVSLFHAGEHFRLYYDILMLMGLAKIVKLRKRGGYPYYQITEIGRKLRVRRSERKF